MINIYEAQAANKRKSVFVVVFFVLFVALAVYFISQTIGIYLGYAPGGLGLVGIAFIISGLMSLVGYYFSDRIVLGISSARPAKRNEYFDFYTAAENLAIASGLPKPKLYVIEDSAPNAFATGRDPKHAVICATTGLLDKLNRTELEGVIAHELSHIKNYDARLMSVVAVLVGMVALLGDWFIRMQWYGNRRSRDDDNKAGALLLVFGIIFAILSPIIANLIKLAISRRREFLADASAISITRQPSGLISALQKIAADHEPLEAANKATAHLYIENPFKDKRHDAVGTFANLFNTHPPVLERIKALERMV
ncbi:MAG: HtpX-2 peptidase, heat shock protein HtpX [Candidatus Woesebacteria bacterium GW2011_GWC1_43_10b]|uniref:Protease HtpX homolog n=1 Tax=Candidatus Woesebacteria bacterium GW2011_GWC1_43_10b TaxID=1618585 RepID=A0A0G1C594_9BACT|nr:MAG: HtpX-2 peptidase, heat shock protein HtpX [Candidatus Woesebacteria bacterium GW2011_GWC1_43_10b]